MISTNTSSNLAQKINLNSNQDTQSYFNNFYSPKLTVSQNIDDAVVAFFEKITETKDGAKSVAGSVILTALNQGLDAMDIISKFSQVPPGELSAYTAMFLNLNRVGTSYLGISNQPYTNKYVKRLIIA
jgi:hypothetical protein